MRMGQTKPQAFQDSALLVVSAMEKVVLRTKEGHTAEVTLHGAHITSWKMPDGKDLLFVSGKAIFAPPKAIRGGVPVCFPQFGMMGPMPSQHGFARNVAFQVEEQEEWSVKMVLDYDGTSQPTYPHPFKLAVTTSLCNNVLLQALHVTNTGSGELSFTAALHTYFKISSIDHAKVVGLQGTKYLDNLRGQAEVTDGDVAVLFTQETDRVYVGSPDKLQVVDTSSGLQFDIKKTGLPDAVVWNPWIAKAQAMADFGDDEWKNMVCLEPAVAGSGAITLAPGATWQASQELAYTSV